MKSLRIVHLLLGVLALAAILSPRLSRAQALGGHVLLYDSAATPPVWTPSLSGTGTSLGSQRVQAASGVTTSDGVSNASFSGPYAPSGAINGLNVSTALFNSVTWDRERNNFDLASGTLTAQAASFTSNPFVNYNARGAKFVINMTAVTGTTPSMTCTVQAQDSLGNIWYNMLTGAAIVAAGVQVLTIYPGITAVANVSLSDILPRNFRFNCAITGTTPAFTGNFTTSFVN